MTFVQPHLGIVTAQSREVRTPVTGQSFADMVGGPPSALAASPDQAAGFSATGVFGTQRPIGQAETVANTGPIQAGAVVSREPSAFGPAPRNVMEQVTKKGHARSLPAVGASKFMSAPATAGDTAQSLAPVSFNTGTTFSPAPAENDGFELRSVAQHRSPDDTTDPQRRKRFALLLDDEANLSMIATGTKLSVKEQSDLKSGVDALARQFGLNLASASFNGTRLMSPGNRQAGE